MNIDHQIDVDRKIETITNVAGGNQNVDDELSGNVKQSITKKLVT
jgi:hypothetical protein